MISKLPWRYNVQIRKRLIALGEFVLEFAAAETKLLETLRIVGNVSDQFARAALSGVRSETAMQHIDRLFAISPPNEATLALYREVFTRFRDINAARNLILHYGISDDEIATDRARSLTEGRTRSMRVSPEILNDMTSDIIKINAILTINLLMLQNQAVHPTDLWNDVRRSPWRYGPQRLSQQKKRVGRKDQDSPSERRRQPKSSRE